ncbi:MAG: hypothetical protein KF678_06990 [Phycisphaeraceae bacterium]|nr:hypothetical protein [Phycisphaeraceae bacterium]
MKTLTLVSIPAVLVSADMAFAQSRFLLNDRTNDAVFAVVDANGNGVIDEPGEVQLVFNLTNAAGTPGLDNPSCLAVRPDGLAVLGDQGSGRIYLFRDWNRDGDCLDVGESWVAADASNASSVSFAFPTGAAFGPAGELYIVNAGNAFGNDAVYRLIDLNQDGDFQDAGEVEVFIGAAFFGPGNGGYSPQEIIFGSGLPLSGYFRNSSAGLHGVYRFFDANNDGSCDDASEVSQFWVAGNAAGITPSAGFAIEPDLFRPGAVYLLQTATGSVDQLLRLQDLNNDQDAMDAGESEVVWSTAESGFTNIDVVSLTDGRVLITDNSGKRVIVLTDLDNDGLFNNTNERQTYFANSSLLVGDIRQAAAAPRPCRANCDNSTGSPLLTANDFQCFLNAFAAGSFYANCDSSSGTPLLTANDFQCFLNAFAAGCP